MFIWKKEEFFDTQSNQTLETMYLKEKESKIKKKL
jgi:hypothetical protein